MHKKIVCAPCKPMGIENVDSKRIAVRKVFEVDNTTLTCFKLFIWLLPLKGDWNNSVVE
jgi:hypothetical protein